MASPYCIALHPTFCTYIPRHQRLVVDRCNSWIVFGLRLVLVIWWRKFVSKLTNSPIGSKRRLELLIKRDNILIKLSQHQLSFLKNLKKAIVKSVLITCISESSSSRGRGSFFDLFSVIASQPATVGIRSTYPILAIDIQSALGAAGNVFFKLRGARISCLFNISFPSPSQLLMRCAVAN